jgi:Haspin like kinase domain
MHARKGSVVRTYGSKPRKTSTRQLWDGERDVPRRGVLVSTNRGNETGIGGFVRGVVDWLSPKKGRRARIPSEGNENVEPEIEGADEEIVESGRGSVEENTDVDTSVTSTLTLISTPKRDNKLENATETSLIEQLLQFCDTPDILDFTEYITSLTETHSLTKLGEASYSEVFTLTDVNTKSVLKIVPFVEHTEDLSAQDISVSNLADILQEVRISRAMTSAQGFADFKSYTLPHRPQN